VWRIAADHDRGADKVRGVIAPRSIVPGAAHQIAAVAFFSLTAWQRPQRRPHVAVAAVDFGLRLLGKTAEHLRMTCRQREDPAA